MVTIIIIIGQFMGTQVYDCRFVLSVVLKYCGYSVTNNKTKQEENVTEFSKNV